MKRLLPTFRMSPRQRGASMVLILAALGLLITMTGVAVFVGLQAYLQGELQKAANAVALAGAASMYTSGANCPDPPAFNAGRATGAANATLNALKTHSSLGGFNPRFTVGPTPDAATQTLTLTLQGNVGTPLLALVGIKELELTAPAKARALRLKYPSQGMISIMPSGPPPNSSYFYKTVDNFPILDRKGCDVQVVQASSQFYRIEACDGSNCYNLLPGAEGNISGDMAKGDITIDLDKAGIKKATSFKISHPGRYGVSSGSNNYFQSNAQPLIINQIFVNGYSGLCPPDKPCGPVPVGYARY